MAKISCLCTTRGDTASSHQLLVAFITQLEYPKRIALMTSNMTEKAWRLISATEVVQGGYLDMIGSDQRGACGMDASSNTFVVLPLPPSNGTSSSNLQGLQYNGRDWNSFAVDSSHGWTGQPSLWWHVTEAGSSTFMHAYATGKGTVRIAALRDGTLRMEKEWTLNSSTHGTVNLVDHQDGHLLLFGSSSTSPSTVLVTRVPFSSSAVPDLNATGINTSVPFAQTSLVSALPGSRTYFLNGWDSATGNSDLYMMNSNGSTNHAAIQSGDFTSLSSSAQYLQAVIPSPSLSAATPVVIALTPGSFGVFRSLSLGPFGNNSTTTLTWSKEQPMQFVDSSNQLVDQIPWGWGAVPEPKPRSTSAFSTIIGIASAAAALILIGAAWWIRRGRRRRGNNSGGWRKPMELQVDERDTSTAASLSPASPPRPQKLRQQQQQQPVELMEIKGGDDDVGRPPAVPPKDGTLDSRLGEITHNRRMMNDKVNMSSIPSPSTHVHVAPSLSPITALPRTLPTSFAQPSAPLPIEFSEHPRPNIAITMRDDSDMDDDYDEPAPGYDEAGASQVALNRLSLKK